MSADPITAAVINELEKQSDPVTRERSQRYFKEKVKFHGVKTAALLKIGRQYFNQLKGRNKNEIFALCEQLLKSDYWEEAIIAFNWAYYIHASFEPADFAVLEKWVSEYVNDWAKCDTLCNHTVAAFIEMYPQYIEKLKEWARSENMWMRRAAAVTLILPARRGKYIKDVFELADILLLDREDLVQKGYGWMLKETSRLHRDEVFSYIMKHRDIMPRTALRYAIEKMPPDLKARAMEKEPKK